MSETRELLVTHTKTGEVVHRVDVTGKSEDQIDRVLGGMLINMSDDYFVADSADD